MPARLPRAGFDAEVWGLLYNDAFRILHGAGNIMVVANGNNPPTVKAGTRFFVYKEDSFNTPVTPPTGNLVYPNNTNMIYPVSELIFEPADRTFVWGTGGGFVNNPVMLTSTVFYIYCTGAEDINAASRGRGVYGCSTNTPGWDEGKQGWYSSDGLVLARFYVDASGNVINLHQINSKMLCVPVVADTASQTLDTGANAFSLIAAGSRLRMTLEGINGAANSWVSLYVNNDMVATNYYSQYNIADNAIINAANNNTAYIMYYDNSYIKTSGEISYFQNAQRIIGTFLSAGSHGASNNRLSYMGLYYNVTAPDITRLAVTGASGQFGIGSVLILWRY